MGPIDNSLLTCEHNRANPDKVSEMKRISKRAWDALHAAYGGGPELDADSCCAECLCRIARAVNAKASEARCALRAVRAVRGRLSFSSDSVCVCVVRVLLTTHRC